MSSGHETRNYRVRRLPSHLRYPRQVASSLASIVENLRSPEGTKVISLATLLGEISNKFRLVATVMFALFDNAQSQWIMSGQSIELLHDIDADVRFLDFTPLNDALPAEHTTE